MSSRLRKLFYSEMIDRANFDDSEIYSKKHAKNTRNENEHSEFKELIYSEMIVRILMILR